MSEKLTQASRNNQLQAAKELLEKGADPNFAGTDKNRPDFSPIHWAGSAKMVDLLVEHGADINLQSDTGITPLLYRIFYAGVCGPSAALRLIEIGADVNLADRKGTTPLHMAAEHGPDTCLEALLMSGRCNLALRNEAGLTASELASSLASHRAALMQSILSKIELDKQWTLEEQSPSPRTKPKGLSL